MPKQEPKKQLPEEEMRIKVEEAIRFYKTSKMDVSALYALMSSLNCIHNEACCPGQEMAWMTVFCASYPDH